MKPTISDTEHYDTNNKRNRTLRQQQQVTQYTKKPPISDTEYYDTHNK